MDPISARPRPVTASRAILTGGLVVGAIDITDAFVFYGLRGASPVGILHSIASGLLGPAAREGGLAAAALGLFLHFVIATGIVAVYLGVSRRLPMLVRHPVVCGLVYGLIAYLVMNRIVVPLSAAGSGGTPAVASLVNQMAIHALGIGVPSALTAAWYARRRRAAPADSLAVALSARA